MLLSTTQYLGVLNIDDKMFGKVSYLNIILVVNLGLWLT